jgi:fructose/tagatose bisphosphate aldolase
MPLAPIDELVERAVAGCYALGYFESWDLASLQGTLDAAEQTRSPLIIGFNGEFLSAPHRQARERLALYAALGRAAAEEATVPCGLIFNECPRDDWTEAAIELGFNLVMPVAGESNSNDYRTRVRRIVQVAHARRVSVEAECGTLPDGSPCAAGVATEPSDAAQFVESTGVDLLAISVGNVHIYEHGSVALDLDRLRRVRQSAGVPLVLHGGTGIGRETLKGAIESGVVKVNYGTYLKRAYLNRLRELATAGRVDDVHDALGRGGKGDWLVVCREVVRDAVLERIGWLGCCGKADA